MFIGTSVPLMASALYGQDLKNKLRRDVLTISQQTLTAAQKEQVKENLGIIENFKWQNRDTIATVKNGATTVGYLYGRINERDNTAFLWYSGNASTPQNALVAVTLPTKYRPAFSCFVPMKDAHYMEVRQDGKVNIKLTGMAYAGGSVMYPLG